MRHRIDHFLKPHAPTDSYPMWCRSSVDRPSASFSIFRGVHAEDATTVQHEGNLTIVEPLCQEQKSPRNQIDQISYHELQAVREAVCEGCKGNVWFDDSDCRYVCPDFLAAVDEHLQEARP